MRLYATLFDSKYLRQGIALYRSLEEHSSEPFILYALCLDQEAFDSLCVGSFQRMSPVSHAFFSNPVLEEARRERDAGEYAWTCASQFLRFVAVQQSAKWEESRLITYIDADCFFFSDPKACFDEMGDASVAVVPHRLPSSEVARLGENGKYNISWVSFRADDVGRKALWWWAERTLEWCGRGEGDRSKFQYCGDQGYADAFDKMCGGSLHAFESPGIGLGPWSLPLYRVEEGPSVVEVYGGKEYRRWPLIFQHFHEWRSKESRTGYAMSDDVIRHIYEPYEKAVLA